MTTYHISKAAIEDASQETALLALLPNCRINAKRRARRCLNMNSILLLDIIYFLVAVPSTYQQCKCKVQFYIKTILKIVRRKTDFIFSVRIYCIMKNSLLLVVVFAQYVLLYKNQILNYL